MRLVWLYTKINGINMNEELDGLLLGMDVDDESMNVFDKKQKNQDGIYRPSLEDAIDKKVGYKATIRFLPNITKEGKKGPVAIEKFIHYVKLNDDELKGYYDCAKNYGPKCPICTTYWKFDNSSNQLEKEKAKLIGRSVKYYSYVLIIEDEQNKELEGKIMIFPYGNQVKNKINIERSGEVTGKKVNVFDLNYGKDFKLIIKEKGDFPNYESSQFLEQTPIKIYNEKKKEFVVAPTDENGKISDTKVLKRLFKFLTERGDINLEDNEAVKWDDETTTKVSKILSKLNGDYDIHAAEENVKSSKNDYIETDDKEIKNITSSEETANNFFDFEDED